MRVLLYKFTSTGPAAKPLPLRHLAVLRVAECEWHVAALADGVEAFRNYGAVQGEAHKSDREGCRVDCDMQPADRDDVQLAVFGLEAVRAAVSGEEVGHVMQRDLLVVRE